MEIVAVLLLFSLSSFETVALSPLTTNSLRSDDLRMTQYLYQGFSSRLVPEYGHVTRERPSILLRRRRSGKGLDLPRSPSTSWSTTSTALNLALSTPAMATLAGAISGGFFAGGLHAIAGPDHLAALLPRCSGQRWYRAGPVGALWGMGHGIAATLLGASAFALKATLSSGNRSNSGLQAFLSGASHLTEIALGLSLIVIGIMGIREAREWEEELSGVIPQSLSAAATEVGGAKSGTKRAVILNGLLHGFSWDGAPSLAPSLALASWSGNLAFLSAYSAGTIAAMAIVTTLVGEGTRKAGQWFQRPDIPQKFSLFSSILAIVIGSAWVVLAVV